MKHENNPLEHIPTPELQNQRAMAEFEITAAQNFIKDVAKELVRRNVYEKDTNEQKPLF